MVIKIIELKGNGCLKSKEYGIKCKFINKSIRFITCKFISKAHECELNVKNWLNEGNYL